MEITEINFKMRTRPLRRSDVILLLVPLQISGHRPRVAVCSQTKHSTGSILTEHKPISQRCQKAVV